MQRVFAMLAETRVDETEDRWPETLPCMVERVDVPGDHKMCVLHPALHWWRNQKQEAHEMRERRTKTDVMCRPQRGGGLCEMVQDARVRSPEEYLREFIVD